MNLWKLFSKNDRNLYKIFNWTNIKNEFCVIFILIYRGMKLDIIEIDFWSVIHAIA